MQKYAMYAQVKWYPSLAFEKPNDTDTDRVRYFWTLSFFHTGSTTGVCSYETRALIG